MYILNLKNRIEKIYKDILAHSHNFFNTLIKLLVPIGTGSFLIFSEKYVIIYVYEFLEKLNAIARSFEREQNT